MHALLRDRVLPYLVKQGTIFTLSYAAPEVLLAAPLNHDHTGYIPEEMQPVYETAEITVDEIDAIRAALRE